MNKKNIIFCVFLWLQNTCCLFLDRKQEMLNDHLFGIMSKKMVYKQLYFIQMCCDSQQAKMLNRAAYSVLVFSFLQAFLHSNNLTNFTEQNILLSVLNIQIITWFQYWILRWSVENDWFSNLLDSLYIQNQSARVKFRKFVHFALLHIPCVVCLIFFRTKLIRKSIQKSEIQRLYSLIAWIPSSQCIKLVTQSFIVMMNLKMIHIY